MLKRHWERVYNVTVLPNMECRLGYYNKLSVQHSVGQHDHRFGILENLLPFGAMVILSD